MTSVFPLPSPALPAFSSLLLAGPFHASAPPPPAARALLFTPSRARFAAALRAFNDDWLNECGGYGAVSQMLARVEVWYVLPVYPSTVAECSCSYPPTPVHLSLALSMLRVAEPNAAPTKLELAAPCLVVLHELSSYFEHGPHNLASYLSLIAHAFDTLGLLSEHPTRPSVSFVLMDSKLDALSLPVLKPPEHPHVADAELGGQGDAPYRVAHLAHAYFEWVGTFESGVPATARSLRHRLRLRATQDDGDGAGDVVMEWTRVEGEPRVFCERGVLFRWDEE
ncbi:hypothetical protein BC834DRAFT_880270 [Gloeopeniophorella convolvens]|nr:hypothetical protein BC834DRAFT_880270 [Gloeopeniophorella convolvens]